MGDGSPGFVRNLVSRLAVVESLEAPPIFCRKCTVGHLAGYPGFSLFASLPHFLEAGRPQIVQAVAQVREPRLGPPVAS